MELFLLRALERLIVVVIGGLSIYLGYRLFVAVKVAGEGTGEIKLPGNVTVMVSRVGPGVFFALFGALVVGASFAFPVRYSETELSSAGGANVQTTREISGIGARQNMGPSADVALLGNSIKPSPNNEAVELVRIRVREHIAFLNHLQRLVEPVLAEKQQRRVHEKTRAAKLHLMRGIWDQEWGRFDNFQLWVEGGRNAVDSDGFRKAMEFYAYGEEE